VGAHRVDRDLHRDDRHPQPHTRLWSAPRYAYSFGIVSGGDSNDRVSAIGSVSATDSPMRVVFNDGFEHFWDGLYIETGDVRRDIRLAYRKELGKRVLVDVSSSAGVATPRMAIGCDRRRAVRRRAVCLAPWPVTPEVAGSSPSSPPIR
jgi:hypothetical protein